MIDFAELKKFFIWVFIGTLIAAALTAVVVVLFRPTGEITGRVFATLFTVIVHSLISLAFIWDDSRRHTFTKLSFFTNTIFLLVVVSFITWVFNIWKIIPPETFGKLYITYFSVAFAALHSDILSKSLGKEKYIDMVVYANYVFITIVLLMLQPIFHLLDPDALLPEMYYRFLAAAAIIDGTLSILTIIFYKLYMHKHPEENDMLASDVPMGPGQTQRRGMSIWVWILLIYLCLQIIGPIFWMLGGGWGY